MSVALVTAVSVFAVQRCGITRQSEFFAKIKMPARFVRQRRATLPGVTGSLNGVDNSRIPGTAAKMTGQPLLNSCTIIRATLPQERRCPNNDPRDAEAALNSAFQRKCFTK